MNCRIAIVDDDEKDVRFVQDILNCWATEKNISLQTVSFSSAERFLFSYAEEKAWDILLLDIEMGTMDGISLAQRIRQDDPAVQIVFITGFADFLAEGYEVSALHYLMKPVRAEKLFSVLDRAISAMQRKEPAVLLPVEGEMCRVPVCKIQYVEAFSHSVSVVTDERCFSVKRSISEMEALLGSNFLRCHRSYLVSLTHIARLSKAEVILDGGKSLPLSRNAAPLVHKAFISYYTGEKDEIV